MKPFSLVLFLAASLGLTLNLHAAITVINDWHMGESDLGIGSGDAAFSTLDSVGGDSLFNQPVGPAYPFYTNNVSAAAAFFAGSDLSIFYSGGQYGVASVIPNLTTNFGLELWVYPTASTSGAVVAYNGNTGSSGWGIYLSNGTNCMIFFGGMGFSSGAFVATNTWTDLALVCSNKLATLYINGVAASTLNKTPGSPSGSFLVAGDNSGLETFSGGVDEVRVFTFGSGQFSPTNLLVNGPLVVTTTADSGPGSLRGAVAAASPDSSIITFAPNLSGQAITLASTLSLNANLTINASALPGGIQINGSNSVTVFNIASGTAPVLISLTITNGHSGSHGGGIDNDNGTLILNECTLSGNSASANGGGIYNNVNGTLILDECTLSGNRAADGGGIFNEGTAILDLCTVSGNSAPGNSGEGGGIFNEGEQLTLNECTLSANNADEGGGFYNEVSITPPELNNTIIAGNSASNGADIYLSASITYGGANLVQSENYNDIAVKGPDPLNAAPDLAPLGYYGGPTQTMPPLPGSPAIGAGSAAVNPFATDQRGYARTQNGLIDIGAVELPTVAPFTVSTNYGMVPLTVEFSSANNDSDGSAIVGWNWNFEDGTTGTGQSPIHVYSTGSAYLPALIVTNSLGLELGVSGPAVSVNPVIINNPADSGSGSLRVAITNEFGGEAITFAPNLSGQIITLGSTLQINTNLTIDASALPGGIKINGSNAVTVFNIASGVTDVLNSVTIANGYSSETGGGINNNGALTLNGCTLSGNRAADGGGIYNSSTLMLNECTLSGNNAIGTDASGGGIFNNNSMAALNECTLSGNSAPGNSGEGGGIFNDGTLAMTNTIDSQNSAFDGADIYSAGSPITYGGSNLVESVDYGGGAFNGPAPLSLFPDLAPLGNYGGPTQTMPPLFGSPVMNAGSAAANTFTNDQRGYPRLIASRMDLGAVEGVYSASASVLINPTWLGNGSFQFGFTNDEDMTFNVFATTNLALPFGLWQNLGYAAGAPAGSGQFLFTDTNALHSPQRFYQVVSP